MGLVDPVDQRVERYADLATAIMGAAPYLGPVRMIAVDGPAGSGKSTFALRLAQALHRAGGHAVVIHTDDLLDGWTDLESFWPRLEEWILRPLRRGKPGRFRRYDWQLERFGEAWEPLVVPEVLIVEGVASARAAAASALTRSVFVHAHRELRLRRGLARDGEGLRQQWLRWMHDEDRHFAADGTAARADLRVDGAPSLAHDPATEFVRLR